MSALLVAITVLTGCTTAGPYRHEPGLTGRLDNRPNIVFVLTDDLSPDLIRYMPQVQALQRDGTNFADDFVVDSLCCPSRSAIFTGEYPHDDGVFTNTAPDGGFVAYNKNHDPLNSFAVALQRSGYRTGFYGKYLNGYRVTAAVPPGWDDWHAVGNGYREFDYRMRENNRITWHGRRTSDYLTGVLGRKASTFIDGAAGSDRPFLLEVATFAPHLPATPAQRDARSFSTLTAPRTPSFNRRAANAPRWQRTVPALTKKELPALDRTYRARGRAVQAVDRMVGQLRRELQQRGLGDNTYFVFSSDNGYHIGQHQLRPGKQTAFDTDIRVPLVVDGPGVPAGRTVDAMTTSIDLCPTFEAIGGIRPGPRVDGAGMLGLWHGDHLRNWPQAVLIEHHNSDGNRSTDPDYQASRHGDPPSYEAVRTSSALYVEYADGEREYYDLTRDPTELTNLAGKLPRARLAAIQQKLHALENCHNATACRRAARS